MRLFRSIPAAILFLFLPVVAGRLPAQQAQPAATVVVPAGKPTIVLWPGGAPGSEAHVFLGVSSSGREETRRLIRSLERHRMKAEDLSDNELAKLHVRHLVGGRTGAAGAEMLYRFEFPERPGALMNFLEHMGSDWNITLFHYRNHGADVGRVLVGLQVPASDRAAFRRFLRELGYDYADESRNPAYRFFLR